ncbi:MAG: EamA family transporter [Bacteroidetes bacterium HGW-Bacteroidetes-11]|nr:MAG: EamA family transporter [Bacteroidetes bacterium HGW-Bacteroidetes-11]
MKSNIFKYYIFAVLSMFFWGLTFVWSKIALGYYEPITIIFIRLVISSAILALIVKLLGKQQKIDRNDHKWFFLLALTQPFFYFLGENYGLKYVSSTISSVIIATIPLFSPFAAFIFTREKTSIFSWLGILVSFAGILIMILNPDFSLNADPKGIAFLFLAVFSAVIYSAFIKKLTDKYTSLTIIARQNLLGAIYFLPLFLFFDFESFILVVPTQSLILAILQLAVFGSCLAYIFFIMAVAKLGMVKANIFTNLIPVFTAVFSYFVLFEIFNIQKISGIILVVMGIVVSQTREIMQLMNRGRVKSSKIQL